MKSISLNTLLVLVKHKVSVAVTFTAITGYLIYTGSFDFRILFLVIGVYMLAGGSSALNEFQERKYDALMPRTKDRPIPSGKMSSLQALIVSILFIITGSFVLYINFGIIPASLGLFNVIWYNLIYTNLKRITAFAVVPGSLVGAVPAFIGWTAAGGYLFESTIVFIAFFMFIWQIPHFWLLMLKYGKEYEAAGFPTINQSVSKVNLRIIIFSWVIATSFSSLIIPLFLVNLSWLFFSAVFVLNILFVGVFTKLAFGDIAEINFKKSFISINVYMLLFMVMLIIYHLYSI
ncbi:MAG: protoheme IX farnesyltransferase [Paludibacter sp.]|nr:protoheme IX farnesyltransferase [Paludibacter sp.]